MFQKQPPEVFYKKDVLENFAKFTEKHLCRSLFFQRKNLTQVFSIQFYEIFKNIIFTENLSATFSVSYEKCPPAIFLKTVLRGEFGVLELFAKIVHSSYTAQ